MNLSCFFYRLQTSFHRIPEKSFQLRLGKPFQKILSLFLMGLVGIPSSLSAYSTPPITIPFQGHQPEILKPTPNLDPQPLSQEEASPKKEELPRGRLAKSKEWLDRNYPHWRPWVIGGTIGVVSVACGAALFMAFKYKLFPQKISSPLQVEENSVHLPNEMHLEILKHADTETLLNFRLASRESLALATIVRKEKDLPPLLSDGPFLCALSYLKVEDIKAFSQTCRKANRLAYTAMKGKKCLLNAFHRRIPSPPPSLFKELIPSFLRKSEPPKTPFYSSALEVKFSWITSSVFLESFMRTTPFPNLRSLELAGCTIEDTFFASLVKSSPSLKTIILDRCCITSERIRCPSVEEIVIWLLEDKRARYGETKEEVRRRKEMEERSRLEEIERAKRLAADDALKYMSQIPSLTSLALNNYPATDEGLKYLSQITSLTHLTFQECPHITQKGLLYFQNAPHSAPSFDVRDCHELTHRWDKIVGYKNPCCSPCFNNRWAQPSPPREPRKYLRFPLNYKIEIKKEAGRNLKLLMEVHAEFPDNLPIAIRKKCEERLNDYILQTG
jgi:hypothetical protein